jgi:L-ascorbate metabolism protein UlaG (beta-lactamase superfamily)
MFGIRCDVAFLPCGGHYTMGVEDAARAADACGASILVPIHWGQPDCPREEVEKLQSIFSGTVSILEREG